MLLKLQLHCLGQLYIVANTEPRDLSDYGPAAEALNCCGSCSFPLFSCLYSLIHLLTALEGFELALDQEGSQVKMSILIEGVFDD